MDDKEKQQAAETEAEETKAEQPAEQPAEEPKEEKTPEPKAAEKVEKKIDPVEELRGANDRYLRLLAEYDNYRKRSQKEKDSLYGDVKANAVTAFLPVYDNLVRALAQTTEDEAYRKGIEMIMTQFEQTLKKLGVEKIESLGQTFDPKLHNAVMHVEDETKGENEIVEVFQEGFRLGEHVIRFAMVKVAN